MAKFIKITEILRTNCWPAIYDEGRYVYYIRPRDVREVVHYENHACETVKYVNGVKEETRFEHDMTEITTYQNNTIRTLMPVDEVLEMINAALEEEEFKRSELYKK